MPIVTHSIRNQAVKTLTMEVQSAAYEKRIAKMAEDMEAMQRENAELQQRIIGSNNTTSSAHSEHEDNEAPNNSEMNKEQRREKGILDKLKELAKK